jgi:hypothetical protein
VTRAFPEWQKQKLLKQSFVLHFSTTIVHIHAYLFELLSLLT